MGNEQSSSPSHKTGSNQQHHHHHPNFVHPGAPENPELKEESHHKIVKHRSLSPENPPKAARMSKYRASFRHGPNTVNTSSNSSGSSLTVSMNEGSRTPRRTKSFRPSFRTNTSFRLPVCQVTGLTVTQKSLITSKWRETDRTTLLEFGKNVFETMFKKEPRFLRVIDLHESDEESKYDWKLTGAFRIHVQRFCDMLSDVIKNLEEPQRCLNSIREFGSNYAIELGSDLNYPKPHVPSAFWDALIFSLNNAAKDMQVETSSRSSESPTSLDRRFLLPTACEDPALLFAAPFAHQSSSAPHLSHTRKLLTNNNPNSGGGSVCPREAEAWNLLAMFIVGQMRFAYELERLLQSELKRLGLQNDCVSQTINHEQQNYQFSVA